MMKGLLGVALTASLCACHGGDKSSVAGPSVTRTYNLQALSPLPGVPDWTVYRGGPSKSAYVPVTLDASLFTPRWSVVLPKGNHELCSSDSFSCGFIFQAVTDSGDRRVIVMTDEVVNTANVDSNSLTLMGLDEADGAVVWTQTDFPLSSDNLDLNDFSLPAIGDGKVYETTYVNSQITPQSPLLQAFDAKSGAKVFAVNPPCAAPCGDNYSPSPAVVAGSILYMGYPLSAYDAGTGALMWTATGGGGPAVASGAVYLSGAAVDQVGPLLSVLDATSGAELFEIDGRLATSTGPMLDGQGGVVLGAFGVATVFNKVVTPATGSLAHFSLTTHVQDWKVSGNFSNRMEPAVGNGAVFACDGNVVTAYAISNGTKLWSWDGDSTLADTGGGAHCNLLLTRNLLFVSSSQTTYALDVTTHAVVWSWPEAGSLSISPSGILYVSVGSVAPTHLVAINLH